MPSHKTLLTISVLLALAASVSLQHIFFLTCCFSFPTAFNLSCAFYPLFHSNTFPPPFLYSTFIFLFPSFLLHFFTFFLPLSIVLSLFLLSLLLLLNASPLLSFCCLHSISVTSLLFLSHLDFSLIVLPFFPFYFA